MNAAAKARGLATPPRQPRTPRVVELLRKAREWQRQLDSGEVPNQAEIARRESVTRARVTQIMGLLPLAPEIQRHIPSMPHAIGRPAVTERTLRPIVQIESAAKRQARFEALTDRP